MVKDRVGVSKKSTRHLPAEDHVYGYSQKIDDEGAGACKYSAILPNFRTECIDYHYQFSKLFVK